jgi:DNA-binding LacI/PurR family transcriptional regulator
MEIGRFGAGHSRKALEALVRTRPGACWLLLGSAPALQAWFSAQALPALVLGSCAAGVDLPSIDLDYRAVGWHAAGQISRSGLGGGPAAVILPETVLAGDEAALRGEPAPAVVHWPAETAGGCAALDRLLAARPRPAAFFVLRPGQALTVLTHLLRRGIRVPGEASILSRDSEPLLRFAVPDLARYESDRLFLARRALRMARALAAGTLRKPWPAVRLMPVFHRGGTLEPTGG